MVITLNGKITEGSPTDQYHTFFAIEGTAEDDELVLGNEEGKAVLFLSGEGNDTIRVDSHHDQLYIYGGPGDDEFIGGPGERYDFVDLGEGNDTFNLRIQPYDQNGTYHGGGGDDIFHVGLETQEYTAQTSTETWIHGGDGTDVLTFRGPNTGVWESSPTGQGYTVYTHTLGYTVFVYEDVEQINFIPDELTGAVIFSDDFNSENGGGGQLNYGELTQWNVTDGTVDLKGNGYFDFYPGNGLYLDLDGSTRNSGLLETKESFDLAPGTYELGFDLGVNLRGGDTNQVTVTLGELYSETFTLSADSPLTTVTRTIDVPQSMNAKLSFQDDGNDNFGVILDNVVLYE